MSEDRQPVQLVSETADTVTLRRADLESLLDDLEDAEDRAAVAEHRLAMGKTGGVAVALTPEEVDRLLAGEHPVRIWREKHGLTVRSLAASAEISPSMLTEIETGTKTGSVETLRKLALALKVDLDALVP